MRSGRSRHAAVFSDHAAERAFDGAHAGEAGLHSARAWTGAQHQADRFARVIAPVETRPTWKIQTMTNSTKKPGGWSAVRKQLATWDKPALLALLKDLYEAAAENRDFIHARSKTGESGGEALEKYRSKIVEQFFPARGDGKLKLGEARKAIRDYRKATGNLPGTAELLMTYVENGTRFTHEYGDIDERFYSSVESAQSYS